ncbi:hypothetical protein MBANPS3_010618 [Mucor bainieri]
MYHSLSNVVRRCYLAFCQCFGSGVIFSSVSSANDGNRPSAPPSPSSATSSKQPGLNLNATPATGNGKAIDLDNPLSPSDHPSVLPGDVNLSQRLGNLKVAIDTQLAESDLVASFLIVERNDQARQAAVNRLAQLHQSAEHLFNLRDRLAQSLAADSARGSATVPACRYGFCCSCSGGSTTSNQFLAGSPAILPMGWH